jgi:hypothetical protein
MLSWLLLFVIPCVLAEIIVGIRRIGTKDAVMGYLFRWLRIVIASPFFCGGARSRRIWRSRGCCR